MRPISLVVSLITGIGVVATAAPAWADEPVTYEVVSAYVPAATVDFTDVNGQHTLENVTLPWRYNVTVADAQAASTSLTAHWTPGTETYPNPGRYQWVSVRVYTHGSLLCQMTLDVGVASCDGRGIYADRRGALGWCWDAAKRAVIRDCQPGANG
jgi:hypothetical protein